MEYPSVEALMEQIRDWAEEEDYDAIMEALPELKNPGQFYEAVLCLAYAYLNQGFYRDAEEWLREVEDQGRESGVWNYRMAVALMHQMRLEEALPYAERAVTVEAELPVGMVGVQQIIVWMSKNRRGARGCRERFGIDAGRRGIYLVDRGYFQRAVIF